MSTDNKKIGYWSLDFQTKNADHFFEKKIFLDFLNYMKELPLDNKIYDDTANNKAIVLDSITEIKRKGKSTIYNILFKSCKYNHVADYMSSKNGQERPSEKRLDEGEKELTHLCLRLDDSEAYVVLEERKSGVSMTKVGSYFHRHFKTFFKAYLESLNLNKKERKKYAGISLQVGKVLPDSFLDALNSASRIKTAELYVEREVLGSDYLNIMHLDNSIRNELVLIAKSQKGETLRKSSILDTFFKIGSKDTVIRRIRLYGEDAHSMNIVIDTLNGKRKDYVTVELTANGIVDSTSMFAKLKEAIENNESTEE